MKPIAVSMPTPMQRRVLRLIVGGTCRVGEIAKRIRCTDTAVISAITVLRSSGLVKRSTKIGQGRFEWKPTALGNLCAE